MVVLSRAVFVGAAARPRAVASLPDPELAPQGGGDAAPPRSQPRGAPSHAALSGAEGPEAERAAKRQAIELHVRALEHASRCDGKGCNRLSCSKMRGAPPERLETGPGGGPSFASLRLASFVGATATPVGYLLHTKTCAAPRGQCLDCKRIATLASAPRVAARARARSASSDARWPSQVMLHVRQCSDDACCVPGCRARKEQMLVDQWRLALEG